jgi:hypothetical protein
MKLTLEWSPRMKAFRQPIPTSTASTFSIRFTLRGILKSTEFSERINRVAL